MSDHLEAGQRVVAYRPFPFLKLPLELRYLIFELIGNPYDFERRRAAVFDYLLPKWTADHTPNCPDYHELAQYARDELALVQQQHGVGGILQASKQVRTEFLIAIRTLDYVFGSPNFSERCLAVADLQCQHIFNKSHLLIASKVSVELPRKRLADVSNIRLRDTLSLWYIQLFRAVLYWANLDDSEPRIRLLQVYVVDDDLDESVTKHPLRVHTAIRKSQDLLWHTVRRCQGLADLRPMLQVIARQNLARTRAQALLAAKLAKDAEIEQALALPGRPELDRLISEQVDLVNVEEWTKLELDIDFAGELACKFYNQLETKYDQQLLGSSEQTTTSDED